jgi:hypothetical protein
MTAPTRIQSITTGYSDSEDRIWARMVLHEGEIRLWLTRRLVMRLCAGMLDLLIKAEKQEESSSIEVLRETIAKASIAAKIEQAKGRLSDTPAPPPPDPDVKLSSGICHSIDITPGANDWVFIWKSAGLPPCQLALNKDGVTRLVTGLIQQANANGWDVPESVHRGLVPLN